MAKVKIEDLEKQIAELQEQLRVEKQRKESLWNELYELFIERIFNTEVNEESEASCKELATLVSVKMAEWASRQREELAKKIVKSGSLRMPVYTDCLNDLVFTLSQPGTTPPEALKPLEVPRADVEFSPWEEGDSPIPPAPGPRDSPPAGQQSEAPMEKLNSFSKRVNVPKPSRKLPN